MFKNLLLITLSTALLFFLSLEFKAIDDLFSQIYAGLLFSSIGIPCGLVAVVIYTMRKFSLVKLQDIFINNLVGFLIALSFISNFSFLKLWACITPAQSEGLAWLGVFWIIYSPIIIPVLLLVCTYMQNRIRNT